jgi:hypothetical protein
LIFYGRYFCKKRKYNKKYNKKNNKFDPELKIKPEKGKREKTTKTKQDN